MVTHSKRHGGAIHPEKGLMTFKTARAGEQRSEVRTVKKDALGFLDTKKPTDGGKQVNGSSRLFLNATTDDLSFPVEDPWHSVAAFIM